MRTAEQMLPGVEPRHLTLSYWLDQLAKQQDLDEVVLSAEQLAALDASTHVPRDRYHSQRDLLEPLDRAELATKVEDRRAWAVSKLSSGEFVAADGTRLGPDELAGLQAEELRGAQRLERAEPNLRVVLADTPIRCAPIPTSFYAAPVDPRLDKNSCSLARAQDVLQVVAAWPNGMQLVRGRLSFGWIPADAELSPPLPVELRELFVRGPRLQVVQQEAQLADVILPAGTRLPVAVARKRGKRSKRSKRSKQSQVYLATADGFDVVAAASDALRPTHRALTRRQFLQEAWRYLGTPYGLGGTGGGRDCSRLVLDLFESFGLHLPRHSSWQARAASFWIKLEGVPEADRMLLVDAAADKGIVLLHFPGHIMIYLGRDDRGQPMALHAFAEYLEPCGGDSESLVRVNDITVSNLELGRGTSRTAFIERITHISVIGGAPGLELAGVAQLRPARAPVIPDDRACRDSRRAAIYAMPELPNKQQPLRVVVATSTDPGPTQLTLVDPKGERHTPPMVRLGGPPFGFIATVASPRAGTWKAVLGDGDDIVACQRIRVRSRRPKEPEPQAGPVWYPKYKWHVGNEQLFSLFVERLFDYPPAEDQVWPNLHTLLRDPERNILYDYRSQDEDNLLELEPDCADLPYTLRAYFAWKLRLPFGYRRCTRARGGRAPNCEQPGAGDNLLNRAELRGSGAPENPIGDVEAFSLFANNHVRRAVHSSSGRTAADDDLTDFYPVALTREALRPGTLFADPYGHLLVVADWIPQGADQYGILVGADAQPDGTIGRRRFWRGSFLFDPQLGQSGAGFKAFRPRLFVEEPVQVPVELASKGAVEDAEADEPGDAQVGTLLPSDAGAPATIERIGYLEEVPNEELEKTRAYRRYNLQQYQGTADDFYAAVEAVINPRPLDPSAMQVSLVDALEEAVRRRITSVKNGEQFMTERAYAVMTMPEGSSIFLASGPWEDYSTPSRDLRLLIAMDSVVGFSQQVRRWPARFGLRADADLEAEVAKVQRVLAEALASRSFQYTNSDGSQVTLTLRDVVERAQGFEMAYNPNDCVELRWAAPQDSDELASCRRHAPQDQRQRMQEHRAWFSTRQRPVR